MSNFSPDNRPGTKSDYILPPQYKIDVALQCIGFVGINDESLTNPLLPKNDLSPRKLRSQLVDVRTQDHGTRGNADSRTKTDVIKGEEVVTPKNVLKHVAKNIGIVYSASNSPANEIDES